MLMVLSSRQTTTTCACRHPEVSLSLSMFMSYKMDPNLKQDQTLMFSAIALVAYYVEVIKLKCSHQMQTNKFHSTCSNPLPTNALMYPWKQVTNGQQ